MSKTDNARTEKDSVYFLKILLFFIVGSIWIRFVGANMPLPIGLGLGLVFASHDHFQIDRKLEYAILLVAAIMSLSVPVGLVIEI